MQFLFYVDDVMPGTYCEIDLDKEKRDTFVYAIKNHYWYQMYIDDLPIWGKYSGHIQSLGGTCIISKILVIQATVHRINKCVFTLFHRIILIQILYGLLLLERFLTLCQTLHENS